MFKTIVVGFDGSDTAEHAMRVAANMAKTYGAQLHLVHTPQPQTVAFAMGAVAGYHAATTMPSKAEVEEGNAKQVEAATAIAKSEGHDIASVHIDSGDPADVIVQYGEDCGADLLVLGRRGLGALGAVVQGSTSLRVNHLAKCPVMTVA